MKKVLITGVAGFIGSKIALRFLEEGYAVVGVDDLSGGKLANVPEGVEFVAVDLSDKGAVERLIPKGCAQILHLAGQSSGEISFDDPVSDLNKNTISTLHLIDYAMKNRVERFIYASSMSVYGNVPDQPISEEFVASPLSCYGVGKLAAEGYLRVFSRHLPFVAMRMFNVYGPGQDMTNLRQGMVSIFLAQALKNKQILVKGSTSRFRDFIYIDDVVEAWYRASTYRLSDNIVLNLGTGQRTTVGEILALIWALVPGTTYTVEGSTPGDQSGIYADVQRLSDTLGMDDFVPLASGMEKFVSWASTQDF